MGRILLEYGKSTFESAIRSVQNLIFWVRWNMPCIRIKNRKQIHNTLVRRIPSANTQHPLGRYMLLHGLYHLCILGDGQTIWTLSKDDSWLSQQYVLTNSTSLIFHSHQYALAHFVSQNGTTLHDDVILCSLIFRSEHIKNNGLYWLKIALKNYRDGLLPLDKLLLSMSFLSEKQWVQFMELLVAMEITLQQTNQTGRLHNILAILPLLRKHSLRCEEVVPLKQIGWYVQRICALWSTVSIDMLLDIEQQQKLCREDTPFLMWRLEQLSDESDVWTQVFKHKHYTASYGMATLSSSIFTQPYFLTYLRQRTTAELRKLIQEYMKQEKLEPKSILIKNWKTLSTLLYFWEQKGNTCSDKMWKHWSALYTKKLALLQEDRSQKSRRGRGYRLIQWDMPLFILQWVIQKIEASDLEKNQTLLNPAYELITKRKEEQKTFVHMSDISSLSTEEQKILTHRFIQQLKEGLVVPTKNTLSSIVNTLGEATLSSEQQDTIFTAFFPHMKEDFVPPKEVFSYLYMTRDQHSIQYQKELDTYFFNYFDLPTLMKNDIFEIKKMVEVFRFLEIQLAQKKREHDRIKLSHHILSIVEHDAMALLRNSLRIEGVLSPIHWDDLDTVFVNIEQAPVVYEKEKGFAHELNNYWITVVKAIMEKKTLWTQIENVLTKKFFFRHAFFDTVEVMGSNASLLSDFAKKDLLHTVPQISLAVLDTLLRVPSSNRFMIMSQYLKPILKGNTEKKPYSFTTENPKIKQNLMSLMDEANSQGDDLLKRVELMQVLRLAKFFNVHIESDIELPEHNKSKIGSKNFHQFPQYTEKDIQKDMVKSIYESSRQNMIEHIHFQGMIELIENERQPALLRQQLQELLIQEILHWDIDLDVSGSPLKFPSLFQRYRMLFNWLEKANRKSEQKKLVQIWDDWCATVPPMLLLERYIDVNTPRRKNLDAPPEFVVQYFRTQLLQSSQAIQNIIDINYRILRDDYLISVLSPIDLYKYIFELYKYDEVMFSRIIPLYIEVLVQGVDSNKFTLEDDYILDIPRLEQVFWYFIEQTSYPSLLPFILAFMKKIHKPTIMFTLLEQKIIQKTDLLSIYFVMIEKLEDPIGTLRNIFLLLYECETIPPLLHMIKKMENDRQITEHNKLKILIFCLPRLSDPVAVLQSLRGSEVQSLLPSINKVFAKKDDFIQYVNKILKSKLCTLEDFLPILKDNLPSMSMSSLRLLALTDPSRHNLHRDIVLSLLVLYAKEGNNEAIYHIFDACPPLMNIT